MPMFFGGESGWGTGGGANVQQEAWQNMGYGGNNAQDLQNPNNYDSNWNYTGPQAQAPGTQGAGGGAWGLNPQGTAPKGAGGMSLGGTAFGSFSGKDPFATDAAAAKLRDEFARMEQQQAGQLDEDAMARGIYSSGVSASKMGDMRAQSKLALGAGLESLFNNAAQQKMAFDLESQRMQRDAQMAAMGQGAQRFGSANQNQQLMDLFNMMQGGQQGGGTWSSKGGPQGNSGMPQGNAPPYVPQGATSIPGTGGAWGTSGGEIGGTQHATGTNLANQIGWAAGMGVTLVPGMQTPFGIYTG